MNDWIRQWRMSPEERQQLRITEYLDGTLSPTERARFEQELGRDDSLRQNVESQRQLKALLSRAPALKAPRNFLLNPADYAQPAPSMAQRVYPVLRNTTAVSAALFTMLLMVNLFTLPFGAANEAAPTTSQDIAAVQSAPAEEGLEEDLEEEIVEEAEMREAEPEEETLLVMTQPAIEPTVLSQSAPAEPTPDEGLTNATQELEIEEDIILDDAPAVEEEAEMVLEEAESIVAEPEQEFELEMADESAAPAADADTADLADLSEITTESDALEDGSSDAAGAAPVSPRATATEEVNRTQPEPIDTLTPPPAPTLTPVPTQTQEPTPNVAPTAIAELPAEAEQDRAEFDSPSNQGRFAQLLTLVFGILTGALLITTLILRSRR